MALASGALAAPDAVKEYLALVHGTLEQASGTIDLPIKRLREGDMLRVVDPDGQRAVTRYETVGTAAISYEAGTDVISLLALTLETGRTHQIRVHCLALGHPVLGDHLYFSEESREASHRLGIETSALYARRLTFTEPLSGRQLVIEAPAPEVFCLLSNVG